MAVQYPEEFPLEEVKNIVNLLRNGAVRDNVATFAHDVWVTQGYGQRVLLGSPDPDFSLSTQSVPSESDVVEALEKAAAQAEAGGPSAQASIPWELIVRWALEELTKLLTDRLG